MCSVSSDGKYIYLNNHKYCYYLWELYGFSENRYIILDKDGNVINEILCPDALALYFGDDGYLFYKNRSHSIHCTRGHGVQQADYTVHRNLLL